jgi:hypothetical protein
MDAKAELRIDILRVGPSVAMTITDLRTHRSVQGEAHDGGEYRLRRRLLAELDRLNKTGD